MARERASQITRPDKKEYSSQVLPISHQLSSRHHRPAVQSYLCCRLGLNAAHITLPLQAICGALLKGFFKTRDDSCGRSEQTENR
ncbi:hypothetical protein PBY51_011517 [Eleginops maclovinus]|uniref:Uncharacterized protein n=1 Tax=Eleginops maclovinus TaxID=56733 RepID=A0AAN7XT91_ELEMC|nr:hypothetical protein PBY51_011517 [Eleginops maclovinus]